MHIMPNARVAVIDDDRMVREMLELGLSREGYEVRTATDGLAAIELVKIFDPELIVLDIMMPKIDGVTLLPRLREITQAPILMLTAKGGTDQKVQSLSAGADDYLVKPFAMSELVARTKALLRRPGAALGTTLKAGNIVFDTIGRDVSVAGIPLQLPRREAAILEHLLRRQGRVVPKSVLEEKLYGIDEELESNAVPVHVHYLRRKLQDAAASAEIHTVRGVGYLLAETKR